MEGMISGNLLKAAKNINQKPSNIVEKFIIQNNKYWCCKKNVNLQFTNNARL